MCHPIVPKILFSFLFTVVLTSLSPIAAFSKSKTKNQMTFAISSNPDSTMPLTSSDASTSTHLHNRMFEQLLDRNIDTYKWEPSIAKSWEVSKDGKSFTFVIDEKAKFWNGEPVTVEDVKFSYDLIFKKGVDAAPLKPYYQAIESVKIVNKSTITFTTGQVYFKNFDVAAGLTVLNKKFYEKLYKTDNSLSKSSTNRQAMGTGPWQIEKWDENRRLVLKRNDKYWAKEREMKAGRWTYERIVLNVIQDSSVQLENLKKGDISYHSPSAKQFALEMKGPPFGTKVIKVKAKNKSAPSYSYIAWNNEHPILKDKNTRWALSHLTNVKLWNKKFDFNLSEHTIGPFSPKSDQHDPSLKPVRFSTKLARKKLAEAGWSKAGPDGFLVKDGKRFELTLLFPTQAKDVYEPKLSELKNQAKKVGVDLKLRGLEWTSFVKKLDDKDFDGLVLAWTRGQDMDLKQIWHSESISNNGSNFVSYKNKEVDTLIDEHRQTLDYEKRTQIARRLQKLIYNDQPYTFLSERKNVLYAHQKYIQKPKDVFQYGIGTAYWKVTN